MPERIIQMVLQRSRTLRTTRGHVIRFKANMPRPVPVTVRAEAMQIGAVPVEETDLPQDDGNENKKPVPLTHEERRAKIEEAIKMMKERNNRTDFTATNAPSLDVLRKETGLRDIQKEERDAVYTEMEQRLREDDDG